MSAMTTEPLAYAISELRPCPALNDTQREKGVACALFANGTPCLGVTGECSEAEGGVWVLTETYVTPDKTKTGVWLDDDFPVKEDTDD